MSTTIQATEYNEVISEREAATPAGARRSLLAMIERTCQASHGIDSVSWQVAENTARLWDGCTDLRISIDRTNGNTGVTILAQT